jgi:hypothetical protein
MRIWLVLMLAACGGPGKTPPPNTGGSGETGVVKDTRTEIERRRDEGCERVAKKVTQCAVDDAKADLAAGKVSQKDFEQNTAPKWQAELTAKYVEGCREKPLSSRQVRVLEVCFREEGENAECEPLLACLENIQPQPTK